MKLSDLSILDDSYYAARARIKQEISADDAAIDILEKKVEREFNNGVSFLEDKPEFSLRQKSEVWENLGHSEFKRTAYGWFRAIVWEMLIQEKKCAVA